MYCIMLTSNWKYYKEQQFENNMIANCQIRFLHEVTKITFLNSIFCYFEKSFKVTFSLSWLPWAEFLFQW